MILTLSTAKRRPADRGLANRSTAQHNLMNLRSTTPRSMAKRSGALRITAQHNLSGRAEPILPLTRRDKTRYDPPLLLHQTSRRFYRAVRGQGGAKVAVPVPAIPFRLRVLHSMRLVNLCAFVFLRSRRCGFVEAPREAPLPLADSTALTPAYPLSLWRDFFSLFHLLNMFQMYPLSFLSSGNVFGLFGLGCEQARRNPCDPFLLAERMVGLLFDDLNLLLDTIALHDSLRVVLLLDVQTVKRNQWSQHCANDQDPAFGGIQRQERLISLAHVTS